MTIRELLREGEADLHSAGIEESATDAWILLSERLGMDRTAYLLDGDREALPEEIEGYREWIARRAAHTPAQYLTGLAPFMGLEFAVSPAVLIPRFDTEILVEEALKEIDDRSEVLDLCTGSGCIGISLAHYAQAKVTASDISAEALSVARDNAARLGASVEFIQSDMFAAINGTYDLIVSNPPYIPPRVIDTLLPEVREKEPYAALDGGEDGLDFYRILAKESPRYLKAGGRLMVEIGSDQAESVSALLKENFEEIRVVKDLAGLPRVVCAGRINHV